MSRFLSNSQEAYSQRETFMLRQLVDLGVTSGTIYACNGYRYLTFNSNTYTPVGVLGGVEPIQEESDAFPRGIKLWLAAVNSSQLYEPLKEDMFNRPVVVREVFLNPETFEMDGTPEVRWAGKVNEVEIRFNDPDRGNFYETSAESELRRTPSKSYFDKETLWQTYSGDTFYDYMHLISTFKATWGNQATKYVNGTNINVPAVNIPRWHGKT